MVKHNPKSAKVNLINTAQAEDSTPSVPAGLPPPRPAAARGRPSRRLWSALPQPDRAPKPIASPPPARLPSPPTPAKNPAATAPTTAAIRSSPHRRELPRLRPPLAAYDLTGAAPHLLRPATASPQLRPGGPKALQVREVEDLPAAGEGEVLVGVAATGVNHDDTVQRRGRYPSPAGASPYPELECSDTNVTLRANDSPHWAVGTQVCAPLTGGGYAVKVVVSAGQVLPGMEGVSLTDAASLPEVACTVWSTVFITNHHSPGESFLMHGGSSGISTFAVQIAKHLGVKFFVTIGM
ncbi:quinone oxidoreductase PIG3-like [Triticum urartu]|uniref:quinone oxidoreductase PIG3-like n=1 Tax=Triticum urartu TaxID=4572 RepID=UPI0020442604|nr:quinone oxidoreductase PIG3-like [Triticum urartu]